MNNRSLYDPFNLYREKYKEFIESIILQRRSITENSKYSELHHVIPFCCEGKDNDEENIRLTLTYSEHFIAHKILSEENPDNHKLFYAYWRLCNDGKHTTPEEYEEARRKFHDIGLSEEHKKNISASTIYRPLISEETRKKMSNSWDYEKHFSEETCKKISKAGIGNKYSLGYKHSEETRKKMSKAKEGRELSTEIKQKIKKKLSGRELSLEHRNHLSESKLGNTYRLGSTHSEESKKKMSESAKKRVYHNTCKLCNALFKGKSWNDFYCPSCRNSIEGGEVMGKSIELKSIKREPVVSSNIKSLGYEDQVLVVEFSNGGLYAYLPVEINHKEEMLKEGVSVGSYFSKNIRSNDKYFCIHVV